MSPIYWLFLSSLPRPGKPECVLYDEQGAPQSKSKSWSALPCCQRCSWCQSWGQLQVGHNQGTPNSDPHIFISGMMWCLGQKRFLGPQPSWERTQPVIIAPFFSMLTHPTSTLLWIGECHHHTHIIHHHYWAQLITIINNTQSSFNVCVTWHILLS